MATVTAEMSMSLDDFIADRSDQVGPLFDWYGNGNVLGPSAVPDCTFGRSNQFIANAREAGQG